MSYILDALRRAEAERGRGAVPGLHTPAVPAPGAPSVAEPARTGALPWLPVLAAGVAVAGAAAGASWWFAHRTAVPSEPVRLAAAPASSPAGPVAAPAAAVTAPLPAPAPAPAEAPARTRVAPLPAPAPAPALRPERVAPVAVPSAAVAPAPAVPAAPAPERAAERAASAPLSRASAAAAATARLLPPAQAPAAPAVAPPAQASAQPVVAQRDLPPSVREQLPAMQFSGATYSANPAYRMAIVNGQVLHEGDQAAPGVVLEKIEPSGTVWAFRGYRYAVPSQ
ncbi:general secretion pathway protein GspB [Acidovorax sp. SUPP950]|uniref:general secretion pathway protein GspB n=1 Tax=unclassified Acidovorax TaxID=2684926 RepID=UPI0023C0E00E|nr:MULTISPECIES: general secretion pathway protein GspB [unclassified Acidovorax]GKS77860.1 general secretion pathway protein GspB [Acidovorax sp. SUPP950]GKS92814.1 general secretion pathway protein GspB [Acidovorax sp. SUPP2539]